MIFQKRLRPLCPTSAKAQNVSVCCSRRHRKTCTNPGSNAFPRTWRTHQRCGISVPRPQLEGADGHDGQLGG